jgi:hypothetical protein
MIARTKTQAGLGPMAEGLGRLGKAVLISGLALTILGAGAGQALAKEQQEGALECVGGKAGDAICDELIVVGQLPAEPPPAEPPGSIGGPPRDPGNRPPSNGGWEWGGEGPPDRGVGGGDGSLGQFCGDDQECRRRAGAAVCGNSQACLDAYWKAQEDESARKAEEERKASEEEARKRREEAARKAREETERRRQACLDYAEYWGEVCSRSLGLGCAIVSKHPLAGPVVGYGCSFVCDTPEENIRRACDKGFPDPERREP